MSEDEVIQLDINDKQMAGAEGNEHIPIVDELVAKLPQRNGKPYLSCFILTHPDLDHCRGFADLAKQVTIGEIWHSPRIFRKYEDTRDLSDDALAFRKEAHRRAGASIDAGGDPGLGNRVRIIGYASELFVPGERYEGFPQEQFYTRPGNSIEMLDGRDVSDRFSAFIHAPFKQSLGDARNETSLAMQVVIGPGAPMRGLFLGDLSYPSVMQIFGETHRHDNDDKLQWNVLLAPHHCSKKVMYEDGVFRQDVMDEFEASQLSPGYVIASSNEFRPADSLGDNPPHRLARAKYELITNDRFLCTGEESTPERVRPIILTASPGGVVLAGDDYRMSERAESALMEAIAAAEGRNSPPQTKVGFGRE